MTHGVLEKVSQIRSRRRIDAERGSDNLCVYFINERIQAVEPDFPFEFIIRGTPVSLQRHNSVAKQTWKELVRAAGRAVLPDMHFATSDPLSVTLFYYPEGRMVGDIDNVIKLTLDAMSQLVYVDDRQVERVLMQKFENGRIFSFQKPSETLAACMLGPKPALYIRVSKDPHEELRG